MNTKEYMRLDMQLHQKIDENRALANQIWRAKNEILKMQQLVAKNKKLQDELTKQKYSISGRAWVELDEEKVKKNGIVKQKEKK